MAYKAGKLADCSWKGAALGMDEFGINIDGELPDVSNFKAAGGVVRLAGVTDNEVDLIGPYDVGAMAFTQGEEGSVVLTLDSGITLTATCRVKSINVADKYKDAARIKVKLMASDGTTFVAAVT